MKTRQMAYYHSEAKDGTTAFHAYATLYARVRNKRYTLAVRRLQDGDTASSVLAEFLGVLEWLDLSFLDDWMDNDPGRNPKYPRSQMLRGLLLCTAEMKFQFRELEDYFDSLIGRLICRFGDETPVLSTIWECWNRVQPYIQHVFDSTHLECSRTDSDGIRMWEPTAEEWVYGLLVAVDCASDLPAGAVVVQRKQHPETATLACFERLVKNTDVTIVLGDSAFDTLEFHERCVDR